MKIPRFVIIFTIWCIKGAMAADSCAPDPFVTSITECSSNCNETRIITGCSCSRPPTVAIVDANTTACSIVPLTFRYNNSSQKYDLILNKTIDLDLECMKSKSLQYKFACDSLNPTYPIDITPKNEFLPWFCDLNNHPISSPMTIAINEKQSEGGKIWDFNVCDQDRFDTSASIKPLTDPMFEINEKNNIFTLKLTSNNTLDYDIKNNYVLELQILDGDFTNVTLNLTINVTDVDNKPPAFEKKIYYMNVDEEQPKNTFVGKVEAADEDKGIKAKILYELEAVNGSNLFWINKNSGNLSTNGKFDREKVDSYTLVVKAYQEDNPINRFTFATVEVKINDVDDNPPVMSQKDYYAIIQENAPKGSFVIQIQATDADMNENNSKFFFEIVNPDPWHAFSLNSSTGIISVSNQNALDFETWTETTMTVRAVSTYHKNKTSGNSSIHINLTDVNDNSPQCSSHTNCTISKNAPVSSSVCQVNATDADLKGSGNENVLYSILRDKNELFPFAIDNKTGAITLTKNISWPYVAKYTLDVVVEDQPQIISEKRSTVCEIFVTVTDVNMFFPEIFSPLDDLQLNITEGAAPLSILLQVNASDKDPNDTLKYMIDGDKGYFKIDPSSGEIRVNMTIDREHISLYDITVSVSDHVNHKSQSTFHVTVLDINDNPPMFWNTSYFFHVVEETNDTILHVQANDSDIDKNGVVEYELQNNHWTSQITINNSTGEIHVKSIDREILYGSDQIQMLVIAKDHGVPQQREFAWITITVIDVNDHAPVFNEPTRSFDLKEGYKGVFYHAQAVDLDEGVNATVHYRITHQDDSIFNISDNGIVSLRQPLVLDGRINDSIALEIEAYNAIPYTKNSITNGSQTLIIHIQDINDKNPVFNSSVYQMNMSESLQTGSFIRSVLATDKDYSSEFNTVTYWIQGGNDNNTFYIDSKAGTIYLEKSVDFDPPSYQKGFSLVIYASDLQKSLTGAIFTASTTVNIAVIDENDNTPIFKKDPVCCLLPENKIGIFNCVVNASDADILDLNKITYKITDPKKIFSIIDDRKGELKASISLDYERNDKEYTISVSAVDTAKNVGYRELKIYLQDENDEIPQFINMKYNFSVQENERSNTFVGRVVAIDKDKGSNLTYTSPNTRDFNIAENGEIFTTKVFDCEDHSNIIKTFTVQVNDSLHTQTTNVTVHVLDQNDNSPVFVQNLYEETINESVAIGFHVLKVTANDMDISKKTNGLVKYKLLQDDEQHVPFFVNDGTGDIKVAKNLTNPYQALYIFYVMAEDQAIVPSERRTNSCEVRIHITRINLHSPVINYPSKRDQQFKISEAANVNSILLQVNATDEDFDMLTYHFNGRQDYFKIDSRSGVITVQKALDREKNKKLTLPIAVNDGKHQAVIQVEVIIIDVNDNSPVFSDTNYAFNVTEESNTRHIGVIKAFDADEGMNGNVMYQIIDGNSLGKFHINVLTGELTADRIDRETFGSKAHLIIRASDKGTPQMTNVTMVEVHIQDINDNPPVFRNKSIHLKVMEGEAVGSCVYQLEATDADEGDNAIVKYGKRNGSSFLRVNETGAILIAQSPSINETNNGMLELYVEAYNTISTPQNPMQFIQINITDVNDKPPYFKNASYQFEINETLSTGSITGRVQATDPDPTPEYSMIMYWIGNGNTNDAFNIDRYTGDIYLIKALDVDMEGSTTKYSLQVYASDIVPLVVKQTGNQSTTVNITVKDVNDNPPVFSSDIYWCAVKEDASGILNCTIHATDLDKIDNHNIKYEVVTGQENFEFGVTGQLSLRHKVDFETLPYPKELNLTIRAIDSGQNNSTAIVVVRIINIDDTAPNFINSPYNFSVDENSKPGTKIGSVFAVDVDSSYIVYTLNRSNFAIDKEGNLFVNQTFDYEVQKENPVNIKVTATDEKYHANDTVILVHILNTNDNSPVFQKTPYIRAIDETLSSQSVIITVTATDVDYGSISYKIIEGNEENKFRINNTSGEIQCIGRLNASITDRYDLIIQAVDGGQPPRMNVTSVTIYVNDVNDNPPRFLSHVYWAEVMETEKSAKVLTVSASDIDANSSLTFYIMDINESKLFYFDGNNLMAQKLDADVTQSIILHIQVTDQIHQDNATVNVTILDVNDNDPILATSNNPAFILEDTKPGSPASHVANVTAADNDITNNGFTYVLLHSFGYFEIDPQYGTISLVKNLNFQERRDYNLTVRVYDHGTPPRTSQTQIIIIVNETNMHSPKFNQSSYIFCTKENDTYKTFKVSAVDDDEGLAGNVMYSIVPGHDGNLFEIDQFSGMIRFKESALYKETPYLLEVKAMDNATHPRFVTANVTINVTDINEKPVWVSFPNSPVYVNNGTLMGKEILVVQAVDYDHVSNFKKITYSLQKTSDFTIDSNGTIKASHNLYNAGNYTVVVLATDGGNLSINAVVHIEVLNIQITNDNVTVFEQHDPYCFYKATTDATRRVGRVIFRLENEHDPFNISKNGTVCTTASLDREAISNYVLSILAEEESSQRKISQLKLIVSLKDINDNPPVFVTQNSLQVMENAPNASLVSPNIKAEDKDSSAVITYDILWQSRPGLFIINPKNGSVIVNGPIDREKLGDTYIIEVVVYDDSNKTHNATNNFTINIMDDNDESPIFNSTQYNFNVSEGQGLDNIRSYIGKVQAYDEDLKDAIRYQITKGDLYGLFIIEPSGEINSKASLDRENTTTYNLTVVATDQANHTGICTVRINVIDINDNQPEFSQEVYTATFSEGNSSIGQKINVSAKDMDSGINGEISFSFESTDGRNLTEHFAIKTVNNTGIITIITPLDREGDNVVDLHNGTVVYHLIVKAKDSGSPVKSSTADVNIYVKDINDCSPEFENAQYYASLSEETAVGKSILHVKATDRDFNSNITYSLMNAHGYFEIDDKGEIKLSKPVSVDDITTFETLKISASDGLHNTSVPLNITVTDSNDHDPQFVYAFYNFTVLENSDVRNVTIGQVNATDADLGENGHISYKILSQTPLSSSKTVFKILPAGTIVAVGAIDRETVTSFSLSVEARDNGTRSRQGTCEVQVVVLDVNDNSPKFDKTRYVGSVNESAMSNTEVTMKFPIYAEDSDSGENGTAGIRYLLNGTGSEFFKINDTTGTIYTVKKLDRETQSQYNFTVISTDQNGKGLSSLAEVRIDILDENDCTPQFVNQSYKIEIMENINTSSSVGKVIAYDLDVGGNTSIQYSILSGADDKFIIDSRTGDLFVTGMLDREKAQEYTLNVTANDGLHLNYTSVIIHILDVNDNCPIFYTQNFKYQIHENTVPQVIGNFSAYDLDVGENGNVTIFMNDSSLNNSFSVDSDGTLRSLKEFDREKEDHYALEIYAKDHGNPPCISSIKVVLKIEDENDNPPVFYSEDGTRNITHASSYIVDQSPVGSILLVPSVRDKDEQNTNNSHVKYCFEKGFDEDYFTINPTTGAVQISSRIEINTLLHLRNISTSSMTGNQTLQVLIMAQDGGVPSLNSTLLLTVFIEPLNEASPGFEKETYNFSVEENVNAGSFIGKVYAVIVNDSISHLTYRILASQESQYIQIDSQTGNITTTAETFDREKKNHYTFEIQVTDGRTPERTAFTTVELTIEDVNDNYPVFPQKDYEFEIPENANSTNQVMNISATDADAGMNSRIQYKLGETDVNFKLNESTGILEMVRPLDRESKAEYKFTIMAIDEGSPPLNSSTSVVIRVLDENDNSPEFYGQPYVFNISENELNVQSYRVHANDSDFGENGSVVYQMTRDGRVPFYIDPLDGTLNLLTPLDYETKHQYLFEIMASDLGTVSRKTRTNVTVFVIDVYDFVPHFPENVYEINYNISQSSTSILDVNAGQGNITYKLTGPNAISFDISKTTGHITLKDKLSPDVMQYIFSVVATDNITKANDSCMIIIHVLGGKVQTDYTVPVPENYNGPFPQIIYDLNSTEEQQGNVFYDLLQIDPSPKVIDKTDGLFKINNKSGILYCERKLDREEQSQYVLTIRISHLNAHSVIVRKKRDNTDQGRIIKLLIIITNVNDNPPTIQRDSLFFHVFKNTKANYIVGKVNAEDKDGDTDLRFNITGKEVDTFHIDRITGQIITLKDISSTNKMKFMLDVYVTDQDGRGLSSDANITILVILESDRLILVADMNKSAFNKFQDILVRNMSEILGVSMFIESIEYHKEVNGGVELLDLDKSDVFIHATNKTTGEILSRDELQRLLNKYGGALDDFFKQMKVKSVQTVPWNILHTTFTMGSAEIALICLAIVIGIGGIAAVCFVKWSDNEDDDKKQNLEIFELESQHGSTGRFSPAEVINPCFSETNFDERDGVSETTHAKRMVEYETQELHMELPDEIHNNDDDERTDSGVDNESSGSERQQSESHSIVSKEESDEDAIQMNLQPVEEPRLDNASNDNANLSESKDHPESTDDSWNGDEENLNEGKLNKLTLYGSQILLDATTGDTDDTDPTFETKKETEEKMKEKKTDLSQSTSKSIDDTESKLIFADDTKLEYASSNGREQNWMQENIDELISEDNNVTFL